MSKRFQEDDERLNVSLLFSIYLTLNHHYISKFLEDYDITSVMQVPILFECYGKNIHQKTLNRRLTRDNAIITRQIRQLEDNGLIIRKEDNENRRENIISLTEKGEKVSEELFKLQNDREKDIFKKSNLSRDEMKAKMITLVEESFDYNESLK